jgi:hypothetical protein
MSYSSNRQTYRSVMSCGPVRRRRHRSRRRVCEGNRLLSKLPIIGSASITKTFDLRKNGSRNTPSHCHQLRIFWELVCSVSDNLSNRFEKPNDLANSNPSRFEHAHFTHPTSLLPSRHHTPYSSNRQTYRSVMSCGPVRRRPRRSPRRWGHGRFESRWLAQRKFRFLVKKAVPGPPIVFCFGFAGGKSKQKTRERKSR